MAVQARQRAYAPYSQFSVGAAILGIDGNLYHGCNVENASYGLTMCAERNAVGAMIAADCLGISALAVALHGDGSPCGACRQVLIEFGNQFPILLVDPDSRSITQRWTIDQLLPSAFQLKSR